MYTCQYANPAVVNAVYVGATNKMLFDSVYQCNDKVYQNKYCSFTIVQMHGNTKNIVYSVRSSECENDA